VTAAQHAAADPRASVWVTASAGTGKTKVLTDRVLRLLLGGTEPGRILCLTFTRAAAAEMAIRITATLGRWTVADDEILDGDLEELLGQPPDSDAFHRARSLFAEVLDVPGGMKILTIHAFCQSLLRRFPLEAGIAPHFAVADERTARELLQEAQNRLLRHARHDAEAALADALAAITAQIGEDSFADLMGAWTDARGRLESSLVGDGTALAARAARLLGVAKGESDDALLRAACAEGAFARDKLKAAALALELGSAKDRERGADIAAWLSGDEAARIAGLDAYVQLFLTKEGTERKSLATKAVLEAAPDTVATLVAEQARLVALEERRKALAVAENSAALIRFGGRLLGYFRDEKAARAMLDYDDQIAETRRLLAAPGIAPWVLYKLDGGLDHILVDESQDTSPAQWAVISALAEEFFAGESAHEGARETLRTIFSVGDEKQSIYSFQGADPDALAEIREDFRRRVEDARHQWREVPLEYSFRSTEAVLAAVDAVFAGADARAGVVRPGKHLHHEAARRGEGGRVELWPAAAPGESEADEPWLAPVARRAGDDPALRLADAIAERIAGWLRDGQQPGMAGWLESAGRPVRAGDIMVLVRQRGRFAAALVRALKARGVEVAGLDRMNLTEQLAVMDLMALGDFLLLPGDDLTLACLLKGPFIGFSEERLFELAHGRGAQSLWRTLAARRGENADFARAHEILSGLLAVADYMPPFEFYSAFLSAGGGRRLLLERLGTEAADPIDEFLSAALAHENQHPPSLQGFLHWLRAAESEIKRDPEQARDEVRVMTVHGAKGLQAPIVFLPDTMSVPRDRTAILWSEGDIPLWPGRRAREERVCRGLRDAGRTRDRDEYRRLLYVAMTRAGDRLYVAGWLGKSDKEPPEGCWYRMIRDGLAGLDGAEAVVPDFARGEGWTGEGLAFSCPQTAPVVPPGPQPDRREVAHLPEHFRAPAPPEPKPPRPLAPSRPASAEPAVKGPLAGNGASAFRRGRLIHRLLELLPELAPEERGAAAARYLARPAHGLTAEAQDEIAAEVLAVLADPRAAPLFGPGSQAEVPLAAVLGESVVFGQVDRLMVAEDHVLVVDYKSGRPAPAAESAVAEAYLAQMAGYRAALRAVFPGRGIRAALLFTEGPELVWLSDSLLDAHAP
jgi:ATP-dependent helicase/nuclease subunit A